MALGSTPHGWGEPASRERRDEASQSPRDQTGSPASPELASLGPRVEETPAEDRVRGQPVLVAPATTFLANKTRQKSCTGTMQNVAQSGVTGDLGVRKQQVLGSNPSVGSSWFELASFVRACWSTLAAARQTA
jgi:hypothetical protein